MRFPGFRLIEQTEQKFRRFESILKKKRVTNSRALFIISAIAGLLLKSEDFLFGSGCKREN